MQLSTKKLIAREWLTHFVAIVVGLTFAPIIVMTALHGEVRISNFGSIYLGLLFRKRDAWLVPLSPYLFHQLVR